MGETHAWRNINGSAHALRLYAQLSAAKTKCKTSSEGNTLIQLASKFLTVVPVTCFTPLRTKRMLRQKRSKGTKSPIRKWQ